MTVIRLQTTNSHDEFRESKSVDKCVVDLATRAFSLEVYTLLVAFLNEGNKQVQEANESRIGRGLLNGASTLPFDIALG